MAGVTTDGEMVLRALRRTLLSLLDGPAKRYTYEKASEKTGIVQSRLHTLAQCFVPVRIDNLPELLIALEKLDPNLLNRELWFNRFVEEDRLRLNSGRARDFQSKPNQNKDETREMAAPIGRLDGQHFSGQAAAVGANRYRIAFFPNAFRKETVIEQPINLTIQSLTVLHTPSGPSFAPDWTRLESDLDTLRHGALTDEQLAYIERSTYQLPHLRRLARSLAVSERLMIASRPGRSGLTLLKGMADWKYLEEILERVTMKEITERNLPATYEYCRGICGNPNNAIDGVVILQYNTVKKELHITYFSPIKFCDESRRPDVQIDFGGLIERVKPLMEDLITANAAGEPEFLTLHQMRVAIMQLDHADLNQGLIEIVAYLNFKGDRREDTEENAVRYNSELSEAYRLDKGLDHRLELRKK